MRTIPYLHDFISELPPHIKEEISRLSTERELARGEYVYHKGDPPGEIFRLLQGAVKLCNYSLDGREMIAGEFRPGNCFGEMGVIDGLPRVSNAVAARDSRLSVITQQNFDKLRERHPEINEQLNRVLCRRVRFLYSLYDESFGLKLHLRLARVLHRLAYSHGMQGEQGEIYIEISHQDLSHMLGASRQSISKELKLLEHGGDVQLRYGKIYFTDLYQFGERYEHSVGMDQIAPFYAEDD